MYQTFARNCVHRLTPIFSKLYGVEGTALPVNDAPMKPRSLARQIITIVLGAQVLCALMLSGVSIWHEGHTHLRALDVSLQGRSDSLLGAIQDAEDANSTVQIDPAELRLPPKDVFAVYNLGGSRLGVSDFAPAPLIARGNDGFRTVQFHGILYRVLQRQALRVIDRAEFGGVGLKRPVTILYASPETHVRHEIFEAVSYSLVAIFLAAAFTMFLVGLFLQRALRPLSELAVAASQVTAPSLQFEPPDSVLRVVELRPLARVLTESVARLRGVFEREHRFVGDSAHELKTSVTVVRSSIQLLMMKLRSPEQYALGLERVLEDNVRVEDLINKMLQLARAEEATAANAILLNLGEVALKVLRELRPIAEAHQIELRSACSKCAEVALSVESARVLISNLVLNAIQHSRPDSVVEVLVQRQDSGEVRLQVTDSGAGISEEALPHIFERFYRDDQSRSRATGGTGLGLSICKSIVESAGGSIHASSELHVGTVMTVIFIAA